MRKFYRIMALLVLFILGSGLATSAQNVLLEGGEITLRYFGHSMFLLTTSKGTRIVMDPYGARMGYPVPDVTADVVTVSHEHFDHNGVEIVKGNPKVLRGLTGGGDWANVGERVKDTYIYTVPSVHDDQGGAKRGKNAIFVFEVDNLRIVHMGDFGQKRLSKDQLQALGGRVDILMIPVGGYYTIGPEDLKTIAGQINPSVFIPMHYKTDKTENLPIQPVDAMLEGLTNVDKMGHTVKLSRKTLPGTLRVYVMDYYKPE
ncbi:MAG: MBL fold metallo-hydrolase [bacterium]